jgi:hypothetical protein
MANKLLHIFFGVDMRSGHEGLKALLTKKKVALSSIGKKGDCVIFLNTAQNRLKMFSSGTECILHLNTGNRRIDAATIPTLPEYVNGERLDYPGALRDAILKQMKGRRK